MPLLQLRKVTMHAGARRVLDSLDWSIEEGERIGVVGANGAGKSTLLRVLSGERAPEAGERSARRGLTCGHLPQEIEPEAGVRLRDLVLRISGPLAAVEEELAAIETRLADPDVYGVESRLTRTLAQQAAVLERREELLGATFESRARGLAAELGLDAQELELAARSASGGQKQAAWLAGLLASRPPVLLLDEPDNHLDLDAKAALEARLRSYPGCVVIVSHDRYLLDGVALRIAELDGGRIELYPGNYAAYAAERELRRLQQQRAHAAQRKEIARIEESIRRFELWASLVVNERHIKQARSRRRALDRMEERGEIIEAVRDSRRLELQLPGRRGSREALRLRGVGVRFGDATLFDGIDLLLRHGDRVGLVGPNGAGKSVLLRIASGRAEPSAGEVRTGPSTRPGYYAQEHETLGPWLDKTPLDLVRDARPMSEGAAVALLGRYLFSYAQVRQPVRTLSGGERSRLQLAHIVLGEPNLLLLDEPTNNLDLPSAEVLEATLDEFDGAILVASHDRYFLDRVVDRVVEVDSAGLDHFAGGYTDYLAARRGEQAG